MNTQLALWTEQARRNPSDVYSWGMARRIVNGQPLRHRPELADIASDRHPIVAIEKSAQCGISELLVTIALHAACSRYAGRGNVLFVMPTQNMMDDFAQARIDRAIEESPYLRDRLQAEPPRRKGADNKRLKSFTDGGVLYLRGSDSTRQLSSVDADIVILDEFDLMEEGVLELARRRLRSSTAPRLIIASTPRLPEAGIDAVYRQSDQRRFFIKCANCGLEQHLSFAENVDVTHRLRVCRQCRHPFEALQPGRWMAQAPGNEKIHGYHMSRLYDPRLNLDELIEASEGTTLYERQQFMNADLGEPFLPPGGGISIDVIDRCRTDYSLDAYAGQPCDMGVDVGLVLHVVIRERWSGKGDRAQFRPRLWFAREVTWAELDELIDRFNVGSVVIDAQPELHAAAEFARRHRGIAWVARYRQGSDERAPGKYNEPRTFWIDRLAALDATFQRFRDGNVPLPRDARHLGGRVKAGRPRRVLP